MDIVSIKDLSLAELEMVISELGEQRYRARQVAEWAFKKGAGDFALMTNIPGNLREGLAGRYTLISLKVGRRQVSCRGDTVKYLFELRDGQAVEGVLMRHNYGGSACISSQAGCRMGCAVCASAAGGLVRNLTAGEMYDQVLAITKDAGERISRVVLMGTGEPLDNYEQVIRFLYNLNAGYGLNISFRHITISTCGLVPRIFQLSGESIPVTLAVSLHAADNGLRDKLVPINRKHPIEELVQACDHFSRVTGRRVTYEYALLSGVNDSREDALRLAGLLRGRICHVNLIPYNPVEGKPFKRPDPATTSGFQAFLERSGLKATVRRELGNDIDAACGQLRRKMLRGKLT